MSKQIKQFPLSSVERIAVIFGGGRSMAQCKGDADYIMNGGFYSMTTGKPVGHLKVNGIVHSKEEWSVWGYAWGKGNDMKMCALPTDDYSNYISGVPLLTPWDGIGADLTYNAEVGGARPRTAIALNGDNLILYCSDTPVTPERLRDELYAMGAETALMMDSGGSTQCDFGDGAKVKSSRRVNNYIAVWMKKNEDDPEEGDTMKKVVLDPGHGVETPGKRSPDGTYLEHEFNLDMANRIKEHLERHGVSVTLTRTDEHEPVPNENAAQMERDSLAKRVEISNSVNPDLFVSIHSNAYDPEGDADGDGNPVDWSEPDGYGIYTSKADDTAGRNIAAKAILKRVQEAGITLWCGGLHHELFYVLRNTVAPAVLIEHGFHTNLREVELLKNDTYRDILATADAKGILDYLGIAWREKAVENSVGCVCPHCGGKLTIGKG